MAKRKSAAQQDTHQSAQQSHEHRTYRDHVHRIRNSNKITKRDQRQLCYHAHKAGIGLSEVLQFVLSQDVMPADLVLDLKAVQSKESPPPQQPQDSTTVVFAPTGLISPA